MLWESFQRLLTVYLKEIAVQMTSVVCSGIMYGFPPYKLGSPKYFRSKWINIWTQEKKIWKNDNVAQPIAEIVSGKVEPAHTSYRLWFVPGQWRFYKHRRPDEWYMSGSKLSVPVCSFSQITQDGFLVRLYSKWEFVALPKYWWL